MKPIELHKSQHHSQRFIRNYIGATIIIFTFFISPIFIVGSIKFEKVINERDSLRVTNKFKDEKIDSFKLVVTFHVQVLQTMKDLDEQKTKDISYLKSRKRMTKIILISDTLHQKTLKKAKRMNIFK